MKIKDIMNKAVIIDSNITIKHAAQLMSRLGIGSLILLKGKEIKGIITERDIIKNVSSLNKKISSVMTKKVITIDLNKSLDETTSIMTKHKIKRLVVTKKDRLAGIITATDIIANSDILNENLMFFL